MTQHLERGDTSENRSAVLLREIFREDENMESEVVMLFTLSLQASQAAQEAELNARKAKNSVSSLLGQLTDLLEQLGK